MNLLPKPPNPFIDGSMDRIAIPRAGPLPPPATRRRVGRACQVCRDRKIRCDGGKPSCKQCLNMSVACNYPSNRRERDNDALQKLKSQNERYHSLLGKVAERAGCIVEDIDQVLGADAKKRKRSPSPCRKESFSSASSAGSLDALDVVDEDINRNEESRATGFVGKNSEVSWLQSLDIEAEGVNHPGHTRAKRSVPGTMHDNHIASKSYHANERPMVECERLNPYDLPPKHTADVYYNTYVSFVDIHFPIIRKSLFTVQYERYYSEPFLKPGKKWLCVLNLIFAIASRHCASVGKDVPDGSEDKIFFSRAKLLSANENIIYGNPDLQQVQIEALLAFYFLAQSQVNRAWQMIRIASSSAIALGINLHSVDDKTDAVSKESRCRLWCSIFMLEHSLTTMTGRTSSLNESFSVHAPIPFTEGSFSDSPASSFLSNESEREKIANWTLFETELQTKNRTLRLQSIKPNSSLYFAYQMDLSLIASTITNRIYGVHALRDGWNQVENAIKIYSQKLNKWVSTINTLFAFSDNDGELLHGPSSREQASLALHFYSTCILINRPCLSRPGLREHSGIRLPRSRFGNDTALACVRSALLLLAVLPDEPDEEWFYTVSPWWTMLHFIMQATTVLLIHLTVGPVPVRTEQGHEEQPKGSPHPTDRVLPSCKKALRWLHHMANHDLACKRGFNISVSVLRRIASSRNLDLEDVPLPVPLPLDESSGSRRSSITQPVSASSSHECFGSNSTTHVSGTAWPRELCPLSLVQEPDMAWFLSIADLPEPHRT